MSSGELAEALNEGAAKYYETNEFNEKEFFEGVAKYVWATATVQL